MTIITESLISECQSQRTISINSLICRSLKKTSIEALKYNLFYDTKNKDIVKLIKSNLIIDICSFKRETKIENPILYINEATLSLDEEELHIVVDVINALELFKKEKSKNFFKNLLKYLKRNGLLYLQTEYFKQVTNKLALFK